MVQRKNSPVFQILFGLLAGGLFTAYFVYSDVIPLTPARLARPSAALSASFPLWSWIISLPLPVPTTPRAVAILLVLLTAVTFTLYGLAVALSAKLAAAPATLALVLIPAGAYFLLSVLALPNQSTDIFNYMLRGRLSAVYHQNPYTVAAAEIPNDPVYPYASHNFIDEPEWWKLPFWTSIEIGLARLTTENVGANLLIYRGAFLLANLTNLALIAWILNKMAPRHLLSGLVLYAWNPITVVLGQSKGDTIIVLFLLIAVLLLVLEHKNIAILPLALSVLIKLTTLPFAAAYLLGYLSKKKWREYLLLGLLFAITAGFFYFHYGLGEFLLPQVLGVIGMSAASAPEFLSSFLRVTFIAFIVLVGLTLNRDKKQIILGWLLLALFFSLFLIDFGKAWYLMTLVALASLILDWRTSALTWALSFSGFLFYNWESGFSQEFAAPVINILPRFAIYTGILLLLLLGIGASFLWKITRQEQVYPPDLDGLRRMIGHSENGK